MAFLSATPSDDPSLLDELLGPGWEKDYIGSDDKPAVEPPDEETVKVIWDGCEDGCCGRMVYFLTGEPYFQPSLHRCYRCKENHLFSNGWKEQCSHPFSCINCEIGK